MPRNKYPEATKQKILDAAIKTFMEKGYEQSTILDVVANMEGLTRGAFYHHFKSKEELFSAVLDKIFYENSPFEMVRHKKELNGLQKLQWVLKANIDDFDDEFQLIRLASIELLKSPRFLAEQLQFNSTLAREFIQPLIKEGVEDGSIKVENPLLVSELMVLLFNFWLMADLFPGDLKYMEQKAVFAGKILESVGFPLLNADFEEIGDNYLKKLDELFNAE